VEEYFQDFDPLRHGSISRSQFRRCLSLMGQSNLTDEQFEVLVQYYRDPKLPGNVMWTRFLTDTESGEWSSMHSLPEFIPWRTGYEAGNYGISNYWSTQSKSRPGFTKSPSLESIRLGLLRFRAFKTSKLTKKCMAIWMEAVFGHTFLCKFWHFQMAILLPFGSIYTKLGDLVRLGLHLWLCGSIVSFKSHNLQTRT